MADAVRTPVGRHRGALAAVRPDDLLATVLRAALERTGAPGAAFDEVVVGCANQAGEDNRNVARMALLLAGFPNSVPGLTVNRLCASGLAAINAGARAIALGEAELVLAGGVESMSRAPLVLGKAEEGFSRGNQTAFDTALGWRFPNPRMEALFPLESMGETAENLAEQMDISREDQDRFAAESHRRALAAEATGFFAAERIPVPVPRKKQDPLAVERDEGPRDDATEEKLASLRPAFRPRGTVTAGNASSLNDGAACVVLASEEGLRRLGGDPLGRWVGAASAGVNPRIMGIGPVPAVEKLLARHQLDGEEIDVFEVNEAFAAQTLAVVRRLGLGHRLADVNPNGGAIALGHPLGMSGVRLVATLLFELRRRRGRRGIASLCVGVGQGEAALFERV